MTHAVGLFKFIMQQMLCMYYIALEHGVVLDQICPFIMARQQLYQPGSADLQTVVMTAGTSISYCRIAELFSLFFSFLVFCQLLLACQLMHLQIRHV